MGMSDSPLRNMVVEAIREGLLEGAVTAGSGSADSGIQLGADRVMKIMEGVHENALGYGQLLGEERVLDALIEGRLSKGSQRHWWDATKQKMKQAEQVTEARS
jgi:hypothetical protein